MRKLLLFTIVAAASIPALAEQDQRQQPKQNAAQQKEPVQKPAAGAQARIRVDGAAGGTAPVPEDKRNAVGAGAGPHLHDNLPSPAKLPRDEPVEPSK